MLPTPQMKRHDEVPANRARTMLLARAGLFVILDFDFD
jgi:hypothetical protein